MLSLQTVGVAHSPGYFNTFASLIGFAVGRTSFWKAVVGFEAKCLFLDAAAAQIVQHFEEWSQSFEAGRRTGMEANSSQDH